MRWSLAFLVISFMSVNLVTGQTPIYHDFTSDTSLLPGTYIVYADSINGNEIRITNGATLRIAAGSTIMFTANTGFKVEDACSLIAQGTNRNPITFTSSGVDSDTMGYWGGIKFQGVEVDGNHLINAVGIFSFCEFENGGDQHSRNDPEGMINAVVASELYIDNCIFHDGESAAIGTDYIPDGNDYWSVLLMASNNIIYNCELGIMHMAPMDNINTDSTNI